MTNYNDTWWQVRYALVGGLGLQVSGQTLTGGTAAAAPGCLPGHGLLGASSGEPHRWACREGGDDRPGRERLFEDEVDRKDHSSESKWSVIQEIRAMLAFCLQGSKGGCMQVPLTMPELGGQLKEETAQGKDRSQV